ncbi:hypothetical protein CK203_032029 [Vitis vinifera]|uniref:Uncharacterized protein n=1 Tax=Vitis vinifera TaxID=29760 RepID=A0A438FNA5_VITVI|nr:hypothetical protein CK203_032029 [Vitis vinifera]
MVLLAMAQEIKLSAFFRDSGGRAIITLQAAVRDRGRRIAIAPILSLNRRRNVGCGRLSGMTHQGLLTSGSVPRVLLGSPDGVAPDSDARHVSSGGGVTFCAHWVTWCAEAKRKKGIYDEPLSLGIPRQRVFSITGDCIVDFISVLPVHARGFWFVLGALGFLLPFCTFAGYQSCFGVEPGFRMGMLTMLGSVLAPLLKMSAKKDVASSSAVGQSDKDASGVVYAKKSVDKLNVRQFCERFCIPNGVSIQLVDGEAVSTEKSADNAIYFTKEQFNPGCLHAFPPIGDSSSGFNEGGSQGVCISPGVWAGLLEHPERPFSPNSLLVLPGMNKRGRVVEASFDRLNKLFEITAVKRHHQTLLTARNLLAIVREPKRTARKPDAKARQKLLDERKEKRQEGTLRKTPGEKGRDSPLVARPPARKEKKKKQKTKKTLSQVLWITAPNLEASSSSCRSEPSCPDHTILESDEAEEPEATSSFLQLVVFHPGPSSPQPKLESVGLPVADKPEEMRSPSEIRERLMQRHGKRLHVPIDLGPPPAKKVCLDQGGEASTPEVPAPATSRPDRDGASASAPVPLDAVGSSTAAMVHADGPGRSSPVVVGILMLEGLRRHRTVRRLKSRGAVILQQFLQAGRN